MTIKIENPYEESPYEVLSHPDLGPFPTNASCAEARKRWGKLARKGMASRAKAGSFGELSAPAKRICWDIFCAPLEKETKQANSNMVAGGEISFGAEFVVWEQESQM